MEQRHSRVSRSATRMQPAYSFVRLAICAALASAASAASSSIWGARKLQFEQEMSNFGEAIPIGVIGNTSYFFAASDTTVFTVDMVTGTYTYGSAPLGFPNGFNPGVGTVSAPGYDLTLNYLYVRMVVNSPAAHVLVVVDTKTLAPVRNLTLYGGDWTNMVLERSSAPSAAYFADTNGTISRIALPALVVTHVKRTDLPGVIIVMDVGAGALVAFGMSNTYPIFVTTQRLLASNLTISLNVTTLVPTIQYYFSYWEPASGMMYSLMKDYFAPNNVSLYVTSINSRTGAFIESSDPVPVFGNDAGFPNPNLYDFLGGTPGIVNYCLSVGAPGAIDVRAGPGKGFLYMPIGVYGPNDVGYLRYIIKWSLSNFSFAGYVALSNPATSVAPLDTLGVDSFALDASGSTLLVAAQVAGYPTGMIYSVNTATMTLAAPGLVVAGPSPYTDITFMYPDPSGTSMWLRARTEDYESGSVAVQAVSVDYSTFAIQNAYPYVAGRTFVYQNPGTYVNFTVPWSILNVTVHMWGAGGGGATGPGGGGAYITGAVQNLNSDPQDPNYCCDVVRIVVGRGGSPGATLSTVGDAAGAGGVGGGAGASGGGRSAVQIIVAGAWVEVAAAAGGGGGATTTALGGGAGGVFCGHRGGDDAPGTSVYKNLTALGAGVGPTGAAGGGACQSPFGSVDDPTNYGGNSTAPGAGAKGSLYTGGSGASAAGSGGGGGGYFGGGAGFFAPGGGGSSLISSSVPWPAALSLGDGQDGSGRAPGGQTVTFKALGPSGAGWGGVAGGAGGDGLVVLIVPNAQASPTNTGSHSPTSSPSSSASSTSSSSSSASTTASPTHTRRPSHTQTRSVTRTPTPSRSGSRSLSHTRGPSSSHRPASRSHGASHSHSPAGRSSPSGGAHSHSHSRHKQASKSHVAPGGASRQCRWHHHEGYSHFHCWNNHATHQHPTRKNPPPRCRWHYKDGKPYYWCFESADRSELLLGAGKNPAT